MEFSVEYLQFYTKELPEMAEAGARYVVVACCGDWRDGEATDNAAEIPQIQRKLRKRFMSRLSSQPVQFNSRIRTASYRIEEDGGLKHIE